jgi:uroporphyrinogen decarboxylase
MQSMTALERLQTAIGGEVPDRIPASVWFHMGSEHLPPEEVARLHARYHERYRWDFLKVGFDYRLPLPDAVDSGPDLDLSVLLEQTDWQAPFRLQRTCLGVLQAELGSAVPLVETVYSPLMYLLRHLGHDRRLALLEDRATTMAILERLTEVTCAHVAALSRLGIFGIYLATTAASDQLSSAELSLQAQGDRAILDRGAGLARMLHLHGSGIDPERVADYSRDVLHCSDRCAGNPDLSAMRAGTGGTLMGGIDETTVTSLSRQAMAAQIAEAIAMAGPRGFILAPGCSVSPSISARTMHAIRTSPLLDTSRYRAG